MRFTESLLLSRQCKLIVEGRSDGFVVSFENDPYLFAEGATLDEALDELDSKIHTYSFPVDETYN